ncbi:MAG: gliding motility-associated C-terminal domain-containing protein [Chitinophagales bacterium]
MIRKLLLASFILLGSSTFAQNSGCPSVTAGPDQVLPCSATCTQISASAFNVGETNSYTVSSIPHAPPIAYNAGGGTAVSVNTDDVWSGVISLPFPFCFFGSTYTSCIIGSNGSIGFNTGSAGGFHPWSFSASVPSTALVSAGNIFGPYHDIDPSVAGSVRWYLLGQAPCRTFIVSYNNLGHYSCTSLRSTHMMVLYETTNVIEVYVNNKQTCTGWNSGNTVIGIQNPAGTQGYTPPGRNTGAWTVSSPEAWQFKPSGPPIYSAIEWFDGNTSVGVGNTITVCPSGSTNYTARTTYTRCDGLQITAEDQLYVDYDNVTVSVSPSSSFACAGSSTILTASSPTATSYTWSPGGMTGSSITVSPLSTTTYTVTANNSNNGCSATASATVSVAQPTSTACNVLYVSPTGTPSGNGTKASPMDLLTGLEAGACNGTILKMAVGDYLTDSTINRVTSYITLEGGFDPALNWDKVSTAGATRILRTATQSTSLATGSGITNEAGANPEVVAISISNQSGFRFQDLTVEVVGFPGGVPIAGYNGVSTVGLRLNSCDSYNIVRTQVKGGAASNGADQIWSILATNGGSSKGIEILSNGAGANIINSNIQAGPAGTGGSGTPNGTNGTSNNITLSGTALSTNDNSFNLVAQPVIQMDDVSCTATNIDFSAAASGAWTFGAGSSPASGTAALLSTMYSNLGRKNVSYAANTYTGFANIILDSQVLPAFTTDAPFVLNQYRVCAGSSVSFTATNGGVGYVYNWNLGGGAAGQNLYNGTSFNSVTEIFNTPGVYTIELSYETNCCGVSTPTSLQLYVEEQPLAVMPADQDLCLGVSGGVSLSVSGGTTGGSIMWSPNTGLSSTSSYSVVALPTSTTTYTVSLEDSTGLCLSTGSVTVNVIDLQLTMSATSATCASLGTAGVVVSGGSGNYSYAWSNGASGANISGLQPGPYSVVVTDLTLGCLDSATVDVVPGPGALVGTTSSTNILCAGQNDGSALITMVGGSAPFTYTWTPGPSITTSDTFNGIQNLSQGTYDVLVTDNLGCTFSASVVVTESNPIVFEVDTAQDPLCVGVDNGVIQVTPDGGVRPYSFAWSNGMPVVEINDYVIASNLGAGSYTLYLTDAALCVDSISFVLTSPPIPQTSFDTTLCYNESYTFPSGASLNLTSDTSQTDTLTTLAGCDSIVLTNIMVLPEKLGQIDTTLCAGESITLNGTVFSASVNGATETFTNVGPYGCDSVVTLNLTVLPAKTGQIDTTLCAGESITLNGTVYNASVNGATETFTNVGPFGCDSVVTLNLTVLPAKTGQIDTTLCAGESITLNGTVYNASVNGATETFINVGPYGCDSVVTLNLTVLAAKTGQIDTTICGGESITVNGTVYNTSVSGAIETFTNIGPFACDSVVTINLTVLPAPSGTINQTLCAGESITVNGTVYNTSVSGATENFPSANPNGCDSIVTINLTVLPAKTGAINQVLCAGESITVNGTVYSASVSGVTETFTNVGPFACDSLVTIDLLVLPALTGTVDTALCIGESIVVNGTVYDQTISGVTEVFTVGAQNCDSTVTVNLVVNPLPSVSIVANPDTIYVGEMANLIAIGQGSFSWEDLSNDSIRPVSPSENASYTLVLTDANGCSAEANLTVFVLERNVNLFIPDAFSPNGDGVNDVFRIIGQEDFSEIEMKIYNRWGELIHIGKDQNHGWNGTYKGREQEVAVYVYYVRAVSKYTGEEFVVSGNLTLIR